MAKTFFIGGATYDYDEIEKLRGEIIKLRDEALKQDEFEWTVTLSHVAALIHEMNNFIRDLK